MKTKIKVTNTKLGVCTFWSIVKFEDKLMQMRDLYQVTISDKTEITPFWHAQKCEKLPFSKVMRLIVCCRMMPIVLLMMSYSMILVINGNRIFLILQADLQRGNFEEHVDVHIFVMCTRSMHMHY